jgi:hypothetical protein
LRTIQQHSETHKARFGVLVLKCQSEYKANYVKLLLCRHRELNEKKICIIKRYGGDNVVDTKRHSQMDNVHVIRLSLTLNDAQF